MNDTTTATPLFHFHAGTAPLLVSMPHVGTHVPPAI
ncbi:N-formylglutamate deformylase, partial [Rhizobium leguminosarum]|nr:N-formylglutamate deformylase [Rhizobium ruizarguesonis]